MATPTSFTADMIRDIAKALESYTPRQSLLMSAGLRQALTKEPPLIVPRGNPLLADYKTYAGFEVVPGNIPPEEVIDWSGCRSPSRAKRRHARGIPQRIRVEYRERAYLINRDALAKFGRDMDARMFAAIYF